MRRLLLCLPLLLLSACEGAVDRSTVALAEAKSCVLPASLPAPEMEQVRPDEVVAGRTIRHHLLAVTWMPETCRSGGDGQGELACGRDSRFGWTLHGLWPNADGKPYPRFCRPATRVSDETIRTHLCRTPSVDLVQHEWAAHGVCGWDTPEAYFNQAAVLYDALAKPDPTALAPGRRGPTAGELRDAFAVLNPGLLRDAVHVAVTPGNRLREVRICHDLAFRPAACPVDGLGAPDRLVLTVAPKAD
jgi:ribonuclease T2